LLGLDPDVAYTLWVHAEERGDLAPLLRRAWRPADVTIRLERGRGVSGVVRDRAGTPLAGARVRARTSDGRSAVVTADEGGRFRTGPLAPGPVAMLATIADAYGRVAEATVESGSTDVVLTLDLGLSFTARIENWSERTADHEDAVLREEGDEDGAHWGRVSEAGVFTVRGLREGAKYTFSMGPDARDLVAYARGLVASSNELKLRLVPSRSVRVAVAWPTAAKGKDVGARGPEYEAVCDEKPDGTYLVRGIPTGAACKVTASATVNGAGWEGFAEVTDAPLLRVELRPAK